MAVRRKRLVKLLRIPPSVLATLISSSTTLLRLSFTVRRSSVTPILDPLVINNDKIHLFISFTCVFSFYSSNPHSFRLSLTTLIYPSSSRHSFETSHLPCVVLVLICHDHSHAPISMHSLSLIFTSQDQLRKYLRTRSYDCTSLS